MVDKQEKRQLSSSTLWLEQTKERGLLLLFLFFPMDPIVHGRMPYCSSTESTAR
jgi:hypothetical protein